MGNKTFPSSLISFVDIPEIENIRAKFFYNFFVPDEGVNEKPNPTALKLLSRARKGTSFRSIKGSVLENMSKRVPRYVKVTWRPFRPKFVNAQGKRIRDTGIRKNKDNIQDESVLSNGKFTAFNVQDTGADEKLSAFLAMSGRMSESSKSTEDASNNDIAKDINNRTSSRVDPEFLANAMNSQTAESNYIDSSKAEIAKGLRRVTAKDVVVNMQLNNKFIHKLISSAATDAAGIYTDEMQNLLPVARVIEGKTIASTQPGKLNKEDYDIVVEPSRVRLFDSNIDADTYANVIGYIIDKFERKDTGEVVKVKEIVIENSRATTYIDTEVRYGATYMYQIRVIAQIEFQSFTSDYEDIMSITTYGTSKPSKKAPVLCTESVPPPPPADFKPIWDYNTNRLYLMWNFPVNPQRDIKKFQIFRRKEVTDPFELITMLDFDDSEVLSPERETIDESRVLMSEIPVLTYCDEDFTMDSNYIYTLCALDARNYTSNYSAQIGVRFDKNKNRLVTRSVSVSGAPKSYPNLYLNEDLFVDTIKT